VAAAAVCGVRAISRKSVAPSKRRFAGIAIDQQHVELIAHLHDAVEGVVIT
jgi:hypothetical protein